MLPAAMPRPVRLLFLSIAIGAIGVLAASSRPGDPLAADIARWSQYVQTNESKDEMWVQLKEGAAAGMTRVEQAMAGGRRFLALQRLAAVRPDLDAAVYLLGLPPADRKSDAAFEEAWKRAGKELAPDLKTLAPGVLDGVAPAALRGVAEGALPQVKVFYEASLEYERNTMPDSGFYYLGAAKGQRDFAAFCRGLSQPSGRSAPPLRSIGGELDALEDEILAAYKPPASIDRHREFITASATLKEARELDAAGLRYGAMVRYLQSALRAAPLTGKGPVLTREEAARRVEEWKPRVVSPGGVDQSLAQIFLEAAEADLATASSEPPVQASAVVTDVLPRYFAALEAAKPRPARPDAKVTVTLVRWPYT
jgi:hypothetical protein